MPAVGLDVEKDRLKAGPLNDPGQRCEGERWDEDTCTPGSPERLECNSKATCAARYGRTERIRSLLQSPD